MAKRCVKTKAALGVAADDACSSATPLPSANGNDWEDDYRTIGDCKIEGPELIASECTGAGATWEINTCGSMYDFLMDFFITNKMLCDTVIEGGTYKDYFINKGCCASFSTISECFILVHYR